MRPNRSHTVRNPHLLPNFATLARERLREKPTTPRRRHYSDAEVTAFRARIVTMLVEHPSLSNSLLAQRLGIPLSSFKVLRLNIFARRCLAEGTNPHSATDRDGRRASEGNL